MTLPSHSSIEGWRRLELSSGALEVSVLSGDLRLDDLCSFAARPNPKRGFLFVSKVLGRYRPVRPGALLHVQRRLASMLTGITLPGPVVVVGIAEAAVALGQGVHAEYRSRTGRDDVLFVHSTRHRFDAELALTFDEVHSHAPQHRIYRPQTPEDWRLLSRAKTVVVVDDEVTTGRTFGTLVRQWSAEFPAAKRFVHLVLTSWLSETLEDAVREVGAQAGSVSPEIHLGAVLHGRYRWSPDLTRTLSLPFTGSQCPFQSHPVHGNWGRFGLRMPTTPMLDGLPRLSLDERILVLGTGEFQYPPFQLALLLEDKGHDVRFQCTTRAPVLAGGAIDSILSFPDNYQEGLTYYLYNAPPEGYDRVLLCSETPERTLPRRLMDTFNVTPVCF